MDRTELVNRFKYHPAVTTDRQNEHNVVRTECLYLARSLNDLVPEGREKALAMTKLEEVMFWANAAIARQG
jgi:hypothetical protein